MYDVRGRCCVVPHDSILCHALVVALVLPRHGHQLQAVTHPCTLITKGQFSGQLTNRRSLRGKSKPKAEMLRDHFLLFTFFAGLSVWPLHCLCRPFYDF
jgi:hypothetical protein